MNDNDDTSRFTIRDGDQPPDPIYKADADNLRIEKLSNRVTLVTILIPCLLVVVLTVAYLDIKHRVIRTQNTGSIGVQNLSKDLESRFSNLSLRQAKLEQELADYADQLETTTASLQVNLKKTTTDLKRLADTQTDRAAFADLSQKTDRAVKQTGSTVNAVKKELDALSTAFNTFDDDLSAQILVMAQGLQKYQARLSEIEKKTQKIDSEKLSKESMDLALGLERLGLQEMVKDRLREMEKRLTALQRQIATLDKRIAARETRPVATPPATIRPPAPPSIPPASSTSSTPIVDQSIDLLRHLANRPILFVLALVL